MSIENFIGIRILLLIELDKKVKYLNKTIIKILALKALLAISLGSFSKGYFEYHKAINAAELCILDSNYTRAIYLYDSVFQLYTYVFPMHAYTASQTAIVANNFDQAFAFIEKAVSGGLSKTDIYSDSLLVKLTLQNYWIEFEQKYNAIHSKYLRGIDTGVRSKVIKIYNKDIECRNRCEEQTNGLGYVLYPLRLYKWSKEVGDVVDNLLTPIIHKYGYPGQRQVGLVSDSLTNKTQHHKYYSLVVEDRIRTVLLHYYSFSRRQYYNVEQLLEQIDAGNLLPRDYAMFYSYQTSYTNRKQNYKYYQSVRHKKVLDVVKVNQDRMQIGLDSWQDLQRKRLRQFAIYNEQKKGNFNHINLWY